jgi:hypothetical protein
LKFFIILGSGFLSVWISFKFETQRIAAIEGLKALSCFW